MAFKDSAREEQIAKRRALGPDQPCMSRFDGEWGTVQCQVPPSVATASTPHEHRAIQYRVRWRAPWGTGWDNPWENEQKAQADEQWLAEKQPSVREEPNP